MGVSSAPAASAAPLLLVKSGGEEAMPEWRRWFGQFAPDLDVRWWDDPTVDRAQVRYAFVWQPDHGRLAALPNLRLVCSDGAGVGHITCDPTLPPGLALVRLVTEDAAQLMAEYVCMASLALLRELPRSLANQRAGAWAEFASKRTARQACVGLMGLGRLGSACVPALAGIGFTLAGWSATRKALPGVECYAGDAERNGFLARTDILVNLLPETPATMGILCAETLAQLPRGAGLVNAGRGSHLKLADLVAALDCGQLSGAVLDVFDPEPLAPGDPIWSHPQIIVTAHGAAYGPRQGRAHYVADIIAGDRRGAALPNLYDPQRGY